MTHLQTGQRGENFAVHFLIGKGFAIIERNYRCKIGEIDIIAKKDAKLYFIEVRTRSEGSRFGSPEESITWQKQRKLTMLAKWYLKDKKVMDVGVGFSVLGIILSKKSDPEYRWFEEAFEAQG